MPSWTIAAFRLHFWKHPRRQRVLDCDAYVRLVAMEETPQPESREFYRQRAVKMLNLAQRAASQEARNCFLTLAAGWDHLAQHREGHG